VKEFWKGSQFQFNGLKITNSCPLCLQTEICRGRMKVENDVFKAIASIKRIHTDYHYKENILET